MRLCSEPAALGRLLAVQMPGRWSGGQEAAVGGCGCLQSQWEARG